MHAVFFATGKKEVVDKFLKWLETRMCYVFVKNPKLTPSLKNANGDILKEGWQPLEVGLRYGVFGTYELVFPETSKDAFLSLLDFKKEVMGFNDYSQITNQIIKIKIKSLQKLLGLSPIPEFSVDKSILLPEDLKGDGMRIIPIGVRYDRLDLEFPNSLIHEAI